jgi:hypothetical protein
MSLDLVVLGTDGRPARRVCLGVEQHTRLMRHAEQLRLELLLKLTNYYEDAVYSIDELTELVEAATMLVSAPDVDSELVALMRELIDLVAFAQGQGKEIEALAD